MKKQHFTGLVAGTATMLITGMTAFAATIPSTYTVQSGDSLYKISHHYRISELDLVTWNHIQNPNLIFVNQRLRLTAPKTAAHASTPSTYVVQPGDCLSVIAKRYHLTTQELAAWNHIHNLSFIQVGQKLTLHAPSASAAKVQGSADTTVSDSTLSSRSTSLAAAQSTGTSGQAIVDEAKQYLGDPYRWGGESSSGFDCSGLVQTVFAHFGIDLPRTAAEQAGVGQVISKSSLKPGDLVFFNTTGATFSHVGIYVGNNDFISATDHGVRISSLSNPYWGPRFTRATNPQA